MIRSLSDLIEASVVATDGGIGRVSDFLFDDQSWTIRYLVADVRAWLVRNDVVIAVDAISRIEWSKPSFRVRLTKGQVRASPDLDSKRPVSRQQEIALREFYGWPAYWNDRNAGFISIPARIGREFEAHAGDDPHLRSTEAVAGYEVWADGERLGWLDAFIMDEASWHVSYLDVKMGSWLHRRSMLVPTPCVESISWGEQRVTVRSGITLDQQGEESLGRVLGR